MDSYTEIILLLLIAVVAFLYSSVGHGGASGYLALLALFSFTPATMKTTALMMNIAVSLLAFFQYRKNGYFTLSLFLPFALASVPFAFLGGMISLDAVIYKKILGVLLLWPIFRIWVMSNQKSNELKQIKIIPALIIGAGIGLLSGMIGIGGGIILTPLLILFRWANIKEAAGISALFIFVNSVSGLSAIVSTGSSIPPAAFVLLVPAIIGGIAGSYYGSSKFNFDILKNILTLVLLFAGLKLLLL